jgi:hypothetical protein
MDENQSLSIRLAQIISICRESGFNDDQRKKVADIYLDIFYSNKDSKLKK